MKSTFTVTEINANVFATQEPRLRSIRLVCDVPGYGVESLTLHNVHSDGAPEIGAKLVFDLEPVEAVKVESETSVPIHGI